MKLLLNDRGFGVHGNPVDQGPILKKRVIWLSLVQKGLLSFGFDDVVKGFGMSYMGVLGLGLGIGVWF